MEEKFKVLILESASDDFTSLLAYYQQHSPARAARVGHGILRKLRLLETFPLLGRRLPETDNPAIRDLVFRPYRIIYRVNRAARQIEVLRFWHGARGTPELPSSP